jgi:hypothetical protein
MERKKLTREQVEQIVREARERGKEPDLRRTDLSGIDLSGVHLWKVNLSDASLRGIDLRGADLRGAKLIWADLSAADLRETNLRKANLRRTKFRIADLRGADLILADLILADLGEAKLSRTNLTGANFIQTRLDGTDFSNAIMRDTIFAKVDLSQAKGLTEVIHQSPSIIDINTIYQSKDKIPAVFLEKAGVHPDIIRWQHSLHTLPTVFICYSHLDEKEKDQLVKQLNVLKQLDLIDIWDDTQITAGTVWEQEILQAITRSTVAILLISANFLTSEAINTIELPHFLERHANDETFMMYPIIIKPCSWKAVPWLQRLEVRPKGGKPIWGGKIKVDEELSKIADEVIEVIKNRWRRSVL